MTNDASTLARGGGRPMGESCEQNANRTTAKPRAGSTAGGICIARAGEMQGRQQPARSAALTPCRPVAQPGKSELMTKTDWLLMRAGAALQFPECRWAVKFHVEPFSASPSCRQVSQLNRRMPALVCFALFSSPLFLTFAQGPSPQPPGQLLLIAQGPFAHVRGRADCLPCHCP